MNYKEAGRCRFELQEKKVIFCSLLASGCPASHGDKCSVVIVGPKVLYCNQISLVVNTCYW